MASTNKEKLDELQAKSREARIENNVTQIQLLKVNPK